MKLDGREIATKILEDLKTKVEKLKEKGITPQLYIILLSDDPSSVSYVKQKILKGKEIGIKIILDKEDPNITTEKLIKKIEKLNKDNLISGIIVQRPMPQQLDEQKIAEAIIPQKDVDGFNSNSKFGVPVAKAVLEILKRAHPDNFKKWLTLQKITVLGNGLTAGKPIIKAFGKMGIKPQIITSKTENKSEILLNSDIIISAVGKENVIEASNIKKGGILIGVGLHKKADGKFHGDFKEEDIAEKASFYSPTPGGIGPVNVTMLLSNLIEQAENPLNC